jgi:hypothetical protein
MPNWLSRFRGLVWTSIGAVAMAVLAMAAAVIGLDSQTIQSIGVFSIVLAILAPKS